MKILIGKDNEFFIEKLEKFDDVLTVDDFARAFGVSIQTILKLLHSGSCKHIKCRGRHFIPKVWIVDYLNEQLR